MKGYLLDTNILSELRRPRGAEAVKRWLASVRSEELFISVLTLGELRQGIELLRLRDPPGAAAIEAWLVSLQTQFQEKILPIDETIAERWGGLSLRQPLPVVDALLAATALVHDLVLVTRNTADFERSGANIFDPMEFRG